MNLSQNERYKTKTRRSSKLTCVTILSNNSGGNLAGKDGDLFALTQSLAMEVKVSKVVSMIEVAVDSSHLTNIISQLSTSKNSGWFSGFGLPIVVVTVLEIFKTG